MKRRELLMLVAGGGSVFAPSLSSDEYALDEIVDPDAVDSGETDSAVTRPDESPSDGTDSAADGAETVELTIDLY